MDPELEDVLAPSSGAPSDTVLDEQKPASSTGDAPAPSSGADEPEKKEDLLSIVKDALGVKDDDPEAAPAAEDKSAADPAKDVTDKEPPDPTEIAPEELAKYSPKAQARFRELANQNRTLRQQLEQYRPTLENHQQLVQFMQANDLQTEHFQTLMQFGALLRKGSLEEAREIMRPYWDLINESLGEQLPKDVRQKVDEGLLDEATAKELTQLRHRAAAAETTSQTLSQRQQAAMVHASLQEIGQTVTSWEQGIRSKDPDYDLKADAVTRFAKAIIAERGQPRSAHQALEWANEAYSSVNQTFARLRPAPRPTRSSPTGVHVATPVSAEPKSLEEAIQLGLQKARAGL